MITNISGSDRAADLANLLALQKNQPSVKKTTEEDFKDNYLSSLLDKCSSKLSKVNSFNDFEKIFKDTAKADYYYADDLKNVKDFSSHKDCEDYKALTKEDYRQAFITYCESRGCYSEKELQTLNKTNCNTMDELKNATVENIKDFSKKLVEMGYTDCDLTEEDAKKIVSVISYEDMAYLNDPNKSNIEKAKFLQKLINKILTDEDISKYLDKKLKDKLSKMPNALDVLIEKLEEQEHKKRETEKELINLPKLEAKETYDNLDKNIKNYKNSLIENYNTTKNDALNNYILA